MDLYDLMAESKASSKEKDNEIFAMDVNRVVRQHIIYLLFSISKERIAKFSWKDS